MKIAAAQIKPVKGDIETNIANHLLFVEQAAAANASLLVFPELSLTGYEPELVRELATNENDIRLDVFQNKSNLYNITIAVGLPTLTNNAVNISMIIFQPHLQRKKYSKKYLHMSEETYFTSGDNFPVFQVNNLSVAPAICYEMSVPEHAATAHANDSKIYMASIVEDNIEKGLNRLAAIAKEYSMIVLMSNCIGLTGTYDCPGRSSVWNQNGELKGQLSNSDEGLLIYNTETQESVIKNNLKHTVLTNE